MNLQQQSQQQIQHVEIHASAGHSHQQQQQMQQQLQLHDDSSVTLTAQLNPLEPGSTVVVDQQSQHVLEVTGTVISPLPDDDMDSSGVMTSSASNNGTPIELQNIQLCDSGVSSFGQRLWTNELTYKLLHKIQARKPNLLDPKLRRRMVYAEVAEEFQSEGEQFSTSDIEKKYTSLLSTYRRNMERKRGSTWQYFKILEDIYSEVAPDGTKVLLPTSSINPHNHSPPTPLIHSPPKQEIRQSKRMRTRPARLAGHVDFATDSVSLTNEVFDAADSFDKIRELMNERLDELQGQRDTAFLESSHAWAEVKQGLDTMSNNIQKLNENVVMLAHTVTRVLNGIQGINKIKK